MTSRRRIAFFMPQPELGGGNLAIFRYARLLQERGHQVTVLAAGPLPPWTRYRGSYLDYSRHSSKLLPAQSLVIATYWPTVRLALELAAGPVAHLCQGYEGDLEHLAGDRSAIEAAYRERLPTLVVAPHLAQRMAEEFGREAFVVPPPVSPAFRPKLRLAPRKRPWIAVPGVFEAEVKGLRAALTAVRALDRRGLRCRVLRTSALPRGGDERTLYEAQKFLCGVPPLEVARALRGCDLMLFASQPSEGFGLPVLESMASGVPVVAFRIPSLEFMADDAAILIDERSPEAMAGAVLELLRAPGEWRRRRRRGFEVAARFSEARISVELEKSVEWAIQRATSEAGERKASGRTSRS